MDAVRKDFLALEFKRIVPEIFQNLFGKDFPWNFSVCIFDELQSEPFVFCAGKPSERSRDFEINPVPENSPGNVCSFDCCVELVLNVLVVKFKIVIVWI